MTDNNRNSNKPKGNEEVSRQTTESGGGGCGCGCVEVEGGGGRETRRGRGPDSVGFSAGLWCLCPLTPATYCHSSRRGGEPNQSPIHLSSFSQSMDYPMLVPPKRWVDPHLHLPHHSASTKNHIKKSSPSIYMFVFPPSSSPSHRPDHCSMAWNERN